MTLHKRFDLPDIDFDQIFGMPAWNLELATGMESEMV